MCQAFYWLEAVTPLVSWQLPLARTRLAVCPFPVHVSERCQSSHLTLRNKANKHIPQNAKQWL